LLSGDIFRIFTTKKVQEFDFRNIKSEKEFAGTIVIIFENQIQKKFRFSGK